MSAALDLIIGLKEMERMATARYYREDKNPVGGAFPGVPLADLDEETFNSYPEWLKNSIDASEMYQKSKPEQAPRRAAKSEEKEP